MSKDSIDVKKTVKTDSETLSEGLKDLDSKVSKSLKKDLGAELEEGSRERIDHLKDSVRAAYRRGELDYQGRLYVDPKYKRPGKTLRIDNDDLGTRLHMQRLGYTIVQDHDVKVGSGSLSEPNNIGSEVHIEQSIYGQKQPGILYEIDSDLLAAREEIQAEDNDMLLHNKIQENTNHKS